MDFYAVNMDFSAVGTSDAVGGKRGDKKFFYIRGLKYCTHAIILIVQVQGEAPV